MLLIFFRINSLNRGQQTINRWDCLSIILHFFPLRLLLQVDGMSDLNPTHYHLACHHFRQGQSCCVRIGALSDLFQRIQRFFSRLLQIDERIGVSIAQPDAGLIENLMGSLPGTEKVLAGQFGQLWHKVSGVGPLGVELLALGNGIEYPEERRGIGSTACDPLPTGAVTGQIGVNQTIPEPVGAMAPMNKQVLD